MVNILCPICKQTLKVTTEQMFCSNNHHFKCENGVYRVMTSETKQFLDNYLNCFNDYRKQEIKQNINAKNVNKLPFTDFDTDIWKLRIFDLKLIEKLINTDKNLQILDLGAWNGWLSHNLSKNGHQVTAIDYFNAPFDGLETVQYYDHKFLAIQSPTESPTIFSGTFDMIIINRCLPYFSSLEEHINALKKLLAPNGKIIITGINTLRNPNKVIANLKKSNALFKKKYGIPLLFIPFKGYVDKNDINLLKGNKFSIKQYKQLWLKSFLSKLYLGNVNYQYAIYQHISN